ncbi:MAG: NADH-quinone oxidoreductase subunit M [Actinobacteria bacterium]|nr:NADH-quinone oxidoreductase subunit M [Actinomycetota bacterium]
MLTAVIFVPLAGAVAVLALRGLEGRRLRAVATAISAVPLVLLVVAWARFDLGRGGFQLVESARWIPSIGVGYKVGLDGLSLPLAALTALLFPVSIAYPVDDKGRLREYLAWFLFLEAVSLGVFLALDLFLFYVFFDLSLVGMYFLIGQWGHGEARRSALKFFIYTLTGTLLILLGIFGLYLAMSPRTFDMAEIIRQQPLAGNALRGGLVFLAFAIGFGIKTPVVPFHTWLPAAHVDAPGPASTILAGVLLKMGTYAFVRIVLSMVPEAFDRYAIWVGIVAVVSIVYGAFVSLGQTNLKRRIAYTSVNHMGYVILGIAAAAAVGRGSPSARQLALTGATVEMVAHGLITGALFLLAGSVWNRGEEYDLEAYGGLTSRAPAMAGTTILFAFASLGLPGLAGFVAEFQVFVGTFDVFPWLAGIGLLGILITAALFLQMLQKLFFGELPERWLTWPDLSRVELVGLVPLAALVVVIGVAPAWLLDVIDSASKGILAATRAALGR